MKVLKAQKIYAGGMVVTVARRSFWERAKMRLRVIWAVLTMAGRRR